MLGKFSVLFNELYLVAGCPAAEAMESVCLGVDFKAGVFIFMEGAFKHVMFVHAQIVMAQDC